MADEMPSAELHAAFAREAATLGRVGPILAHLLSTPDQTLFSDEIVARVRGMLGDLAAQVLRAQAEATGHAARDDFAARHSPALAEHFATSPALLAHCHALALEWQLTARLEADAGIDPVLSPLLQDMIASPDSALASAAMAALAAQARFAQAQRRMELPMAGLPGDLFHETLTLWRGFAAARPSDAITRTEAKLRKGFEEGAGRLALLVRLIAGLGSQATGALNPARAGVALFLSGFAQVSGQSRDTAVFATNEGQVLRLAVGLRAAGLSDAALAEVVLALHPDVAVPAGLGALSPAAAQQMLVAEAREGAWRG